MAFAASPELPALAGPRHRWRLAPRWWGLLGIVGIPTLAAGAYYGLIASDVYISEAKFTIRGDRPAPGGALDMALFGIGGGEDALIAREYVLSHAIVSQLDERVGLRQAFGAHWIDPLQRLEHAASSEELTAYFAAMVEVGFEPESSVTTLRVRAFTPDDAERIAAAIMTLSEGVVNGLSARVTDDMLGFARAELARAESRVSTARRAITAFRDRTDALDPALEAGSILGIIGEMEARLAEERAALMELRSYLREDSARIAAAKARITAVAAQISEERARLTGEDGGRLSEVVADYEELQLELEFARNVYTTMLGSLEAARAEAQKQQKYLIPVVTPNRPDEALEPRRALSVFTVFIGSLISYGIGALLLAAVREHAEV